jgi:hypothetical protein
MTLPIIVNQLHMCSNGDYTVYCDLSVKLGLTLVRFMPRSE